MTEWEVKEILKTRVQDAWAIMCDYSTNYGSLDPTTVKARTRWVTLDDLWNEIYPNEEY